MDKKSEIKLERLYSIDNGTSLDFDPSEPCIIASWVGFTMSEEFRSFLDKSLEFIEEKAQTYGKVGWVSDYSQGEMVMDEDVKWVAENWTVRAYKAGLRYIALIIHGNSFLEMAANDFMETTEKIGEVTARQFSDWESAKAWLHEVLSNE